MMAKIVDPAYAKAGAPDSGRRTVLDMDSTEVPVRVQDFDLGSNAKEIASEAMMVHWLAA